MNFYCKIGEVETTTPWDRPNLENLKKWYNEWKNTPGVENYEAYLLGNFAEITFGESPLETWDVDVVLVRPDIVDYAEMSNIMKEAVRIGFENRILIDVYYNNKLLNFERFEPIVQVRGFDRFYKERGEEVYEWNLKGDRVKELLPGKLWEISHPHPSKSVIKAFTRYEQGIYKGLQINIKDIL